MKQTKDTCNKDENDYTRLTLDQGDKKITWEVSSKDVTNEDMIYAIRTIMAGMEFSEDDIEYAMISYLYENSDIFKTSENNQIILSEEEIKEELAKVNDKLPKA